MLKCRMQYEKRGPAQYISHLDLMRCFRRAFMRADVMLVFSQGFNPHPYISVPLPLPTGFASRCELLDFDTEDLPDDFLARMTKALPEGIVPKFVYQRTRGAGDIAAVRYTVTVHGEGLDADAVRALFAEPVRMLKKTKRGESEVDLRDFIRSLDVQGGADKLFLDAVLAAGEQSLNPEYLVRAVSEHGSTVSWAEYLRTAILDKDGEPFA